MHMLLKFERPLGVLFSNVDLGFPMNWIIKTKLPIWFVAAFHLAFIMSCYLRSRPSHSSLFLICLTGIALWQFLGSFLCYWKMYLYSAKFVDKLIFLKVQFLKLGGKDSVGEVEPTKLVVVVHLLLFIFILLIINVRVVRVSRLFNFLLFVFHFWVIIGLSHCLVIIINKISKIMFKKIHFTSIDSLMFALQGITLYC